MKQEIKQVGIRQFFKKELKGGDNMAWRKKKESKPVEPIAVEPPTEPIAVEQPAPIQQIQPVVSQPPQPIQPVVYQPQVVQPVWSIQDVQINDVTKIIYNSKTGEQLDFNGAIVKILNLLEEE